MATNNNRETSIIHECDGTSIVLTHGVEIHAIDPWMDHDQYVITCHDDTYTMAFTTQMHIPSRDDDDDVTIDVVETQFNDVWHYTSHDITNMCQFIESNVCVGPIDYARITTK